MKKAKPAPEFTSKTTRRAIDIEIKWDKGMIMMTLTQEMTEEGIMSGELEKLAQEICRTVQRTILKHNSVALDFTVS